MRLIISSPDLRLRAVLCLPFWCYDDRSLDFHDRQAYRSAKFSGSGQFAQIRGCMRPSFAVWAQNVITIH